MKTLINWTAKRAGGRMTIYGTDKETNAITKAVGVDRIEAPGVGAASTFSQPIATDKNGATFLLA